MASTKETCNFSVEVPRALLLVFNNKYLNLVETFYCVNLVEQDADVDKTTFSIKFKYTPDPENVDEIVSDIQNYVEWTLGATAASAAAECGEDSSYDSEHESESGHRAASRTPSDTLAAEFAEHVTLASPNNAKVEFALKLGYSKKTALEALQKLGPDPPHNELLSELSRLETEAKETAGPDTIRPKLRHIVIDGSNVAMSHGNKEVFSSRGIELCVEWFRSRGHTDITVFVPKWRKELRPDNPVTGREILDKLEKERILVYTPSRLAGGRRLVCYDDRYTLRLAVETDGIVVSNDNYHDLVTESAEFRKVVDERVLMYTFVNDIFMPPDDPLGRTGPTLDEFLSTKELPPPCPYDKKCTYGNKCKYYHPDRARSHKALKKNLHTLSLPPAPVHSDSKRPLARAQSATPRLPDASLSTHFDRAQLQNPYRPPDNPHKKLARQLTLNPTCDPRLPPLSTAHTAASRVASAPAGIADLAWSQMPWPMNSNACSSESALPLWETRRRMHYHLSGIFPEAQVSEAMAAFPDETDAQNMCAIILARYRSELPRYHPDYRRT